MENAWLIVGLGNPGQSYQRTRHNVGFMVVQSLAQRWECLWAEDGKFRAGLALAKRADKRIFLVQPLTFMNASGEAVASLARFYKVSPARVLVVVDDADLPLGEVRMRAGGGTGGHHGLESVESSLATRVFPRLRVGIGRGEGQTRQITGYVLSPFRLQEIGLLKKVLERACDQVECWLDNGLQQAMNRYNGRIEN